MAGMLYAVVRLFFADHQRISRGGLNFEIDLNEGIEFHLFLFGNFQKHVIENNVLNLPSNGVILDVGANTGIMTLFFAKKVPQGTVHSFEPTDYAFNKMQNNLRLNPKYQNSITTTQAFVSSANEQDHGLSAYSSWPLKSEGAKHDIHGGVVKSAQDVPSITLDQYCEDHKLDRVNLIKIDTDGHEYEVLNGMEQVLSDCRPQVIFEIGIYVMQERGLSFGHYSSFFERFDYQLLTTQGDRVNLENHRDFIPQYGTIDLIAIPSSSAEAI